MVRESLYSDVTTLALKKGERLFPFMAYKETRDWDGIYEEWIRIVKYCKRHGYIWREKKE